MRHSLPVVLLGLLAGCGRGGSGNGEAVPETPAPSTAPSVTAAQVYRPTFNMRGNRASAGTGYFLTAPSGKVVAITAQHVLDKPEWGSVSGVSFDAMDNGSSVPVGAKPDYLGRSFDELPTIEGGRFPVFDTSEDFAVWVLAGTKKPQVLELAAEDPKANQWVWCAGEEGGRAFALYLAKVTKVKGGTMQMQQHAKFAPRGFSGGPVFSADGKVVGNVLAADPGSGQMAGATAATIRKRISGY